MVDFKYLYNGICGLANAHPLGTMAGHLGAAVVAGYFIGEDQGDLPDPVVDGIEAELQRVMAGEEAIWFDVKKSGVTAAELFKPLPAGAPQPETIKSIAVALQKNIGTLRQSGHNVIFASLGLRALHGHDIYATPAIVTGIRTLIKKFDKVNQGRGYFGKSSEKNNGWLNGDQVKLVEDNSLPAYQSIQQMVDVTIDELIATASIKKQGFGGLWHIINHAAAISELDRLNYPEIAKQALPAHRHHIRLWRSLPDVEEELGPVTKAVHDPFDAEFWKEDLKRDSAQLTHRIKTLYGYHTIRPFVDDEKKTKLADDALLYLMD